MIFTYLQCLNDCLDCLVLLSSIKTRFLATVWAVFYILYHIIYSLEIRQLAITHLICYFYDKLELAPNFNSAPTPPPPCSPTPSQSRDANPQAASCYQYYSHLKIGLKLIVKVHYVLVNTKVSRD